ncbi:MULTISPECIES: signal peptidase II [Idiomarina]|uniref:Lipoprotein signal peptidase n=1 Tax=Idiomarina abyssalis TaxID=86102 RepID=A0A8I1GB47_9GAMM|nr:MULTISPECIES: signal peptidase II [Idiomarina]RDX35113.1 lipoprotein signal peptidase [Idiomarina sp. HD9-110m-PIT-SAG05]KPD22144.1 lipoprotein signal peptidase [Idiomarina abyssalis]MAL84166.1 lipoprotein signal peptidase [Idiomarina sp.]MAO67498.1 lipoprotein signal peptidase [Idiomarina sp.]MBF80319.1 lipoprotein signal peptidase [Idiomarina sp.]
MPDFANQTNRATGLRFLWLTLLLVVVDQITKIWVAGEFELYESRVVIEGLFNFTYVHNYGAAFSFLSDGGGWQRWFFTVIAIAISAVLLIWMRRNPVGLWRQNLAFSLILAGAIGNVADRLMYGYVIDFFDVHYQGWHWPAFNVADMAITIGAALMLLEAFFDNRRDKAEDGHKQ